MRVNKPRKNILANIEQETSQQITPQLKTSDLSTIISARTGLIPEDKAVMKTLPKSYSGKTIEEALDYLLQQKDLQDDEIPFAQSIKQELKSDNFIVIVNGKNAELTDCLADYIVAKKRKLPDQKVMSYNALDIEISSVQEGGRYQL
jgi:hypothetical protein